MTLVAKLSTEVVSTFKVVRILSQSRTETDVYTPEISYPPNS
jgi:hypothetical protein